MKMYRACGNFLTSVALLFVLCGFFISATQQKEDEGLLQYKSYFNTPENNIYELDILPDYQIERYVFPKNVPLAEGEIINQEDEDATILLRIPGSPQSPKAEGKRPSFIQHGIFCDFNPCTVNKPQIAIAYLLVDQGYDVWLGISNSSIAENLISNERIEKTKLDKIAQSILSTTNQPELLVMGYFNGSTQFFAITADFKKPEQSRLSKWIEKIPGVKTVKKWYNNAYNNGKRLFNRYDKMLENFNIVGKKLDYIIDNQSIRNLKNTVFHAWGIVTSMVVPTFGVNDFSQMINHPDIYLDTAQLVKKYGYAVETHEVKTEDGYLLAMHRISGSKKYPPRPDKPVVFLQHGILASSAVWVLTGPTKGLGYILADEGYDVWMGNSRGNVYSRAHENFLPSHSDFWNFTWHEMGVYDLPASIDYILLKTGQRKVFYLGHSQGTTSFFVMMSQRPEYNEKIAKFAAYAPLVYASHVQSPIVDFFAKMSAPIYRALSMLKIYDFLPTNAFLTKMGRNTCEARSLYQVICSNTLFMITGYDSAQINKTVIPIILGHLPAGSSVKQFFHYGQLMKEKKFQQFNYDDPQKNMEIYGQLTPPSYQINNTRVPTAIFYANNDLLADVRDVEKLAGELPNVKVLQKVPMELFNHIDFMFAIDAPALLYRPTIQFFEDP